jgi:hypothetical protein
MNVILLKMAKIGENPAVWHEIVLPSIETLKSLGITIQKVFSLSSDRTFEYEVLGCRAPGHRARLRDLLISGIAQFRYLHNGTQKQKIEIVMVPLGNLHLGHHSSKSK